MKRLHKLTAALLTCTLGASAMPVSAAAEDPVLMDATVQMNGDSIEIVTEQTQSTGISAEGSIITITASGAYQFEGTLTDGQICVNIPDEVADPGTVKLYFNGVDVTGVAQCPLYVVNAENTSVNLMDGSVNYLRDGALYTDTTAVIYAKDDITIKGGDTETAGKLTVESVYQHGIHCNNDVKISGGILKVRTNDGDGTTTGIGDGIRGKTSVEIKGGDVDVNAGGDGVKSTKGNVTISGGKTEIKAGNDAVQGETGLDISGGSLKANGDRGLRLDNGTINITGGEILATATDYQVNNPDNNSVINVTQPTMLLSFAEEQVKDQEITITDKETNETVYSFTPDKKFKHLLISTPAISFDKQYEKQYVGTIAGKKATLSANSEFTVSEDNLLITATELFLQEIQYSYDVDCDGTVELEDAVLLARIICEDTALRPTVTAEQINAADINQDGFLDNRDLTEMLKYLAQ